MIDLHLTVNGQPRRERVEPTLRLVELLRGRLGLTGTHEGCDTAQCGCCTVLVDGQAVKSCNLLAAQVAGREVTTIEGLARPGAGGRGAVGGEPGASGALHPVQEAFVACHGLQCGFCTPGMVMSTVALLAREPRPDDAAIVAALEGNLCRCTGYVNIVAAVRQAAATLAGEAP